MPKTQLTRQEVILAVNRVPGLCREFYSGSWSWYARDIQPVGHETVMERPNMRRNLYHVSAVKIIADRIGYRRRV